MRQRGWWQILISLPTISFLIMASCKRPNGNGPEPPPPPPPVFMEQPISFCWQKPLKPQKASVQILLDASGSMVGFQRAVPRLVNWVQHGVSQLQDSTIVMDRFRVCQFSQKLGGGIAQCSGVSQLLASYQPSGDTNLHDAIRSATDSELTFILTDGVAATGSHGAGNCAAGVDAACVARALQEAMHTSVPDGGDVDRGLWVIPVVATYNGLFFTEEPIVPTNFQPANTIQQVSSDIGTPVVVQNPRAGADGHLVFGYQGPRAMLLIVMARWADVGRAAVQALWGQSKLVGIQSIEQMKGFSADLACMSPIEVYPGFLNPVHWDKLEEEEFQGTMDVNLQTDSTKSRIGVMCPQNTSGAGKFRLIGSTTADSHVAGCVPIQLLPAFTFQFQPVRPEDGPEWRQFIEGFECQDNSYTNLKLHLACSTEKLRPCAENPISLQWVAYMNYIKAADCLASPDCTRPGQIIHSLSTTHPSREPHRIFGFSETLEAFYREVAQDQRSIVLANLDVCHQR